MLRIEGNKELVVQQPGENFYEIIQEIIREYERFLGSRLLASHKLLLDNIADELQSTEDRFILEFIQNAVDSGGGTPVHVRFQLQARRLVVANNGRPFTRQDVERICGLSGERKRKKIGYKGIGFKSVARITDNPQIYSPGCQFEFDRRSYAEYDPLWLVVPRWIERPRPRFIKPDWVTFVLPFKESIRSGHLYDTFAGILTRKTGALLLFLDDLGQLEVEDSRQGKYFAMRKRIDRDDLIAIEEKSDKAGEWQLRGRWLVVDYAPPGRDPAAERDYSQRRLKFTDGSPAEVGETRLTLAFHLDETQTFVRKQDGPVYAFLPLDKQKSRFYFTLQADFLTDMSRKALAAPSDWNEWLISHIPDAVIAAIEQIKRLGNPALYSIIYQAFPLNRRINAPFDRAMAVLPARLKETRLILTGRGEWVRPDEAVWLAPDLAALLVDTAGLFPGRPAIVAPEIQGKETEKFLQSLGVLFVTGPADLIDHLEKNPGWLRAQSIDWLARFFGYLAAARPGYADLKRLKNLPLVPVQEGWASAGAGDVFFPPPAGGPPLAGVQLIRNDLPSEILAFLREEFHLQPVTPLVQLEQAVLPALEQGNLPPEQLPEFVGIAKAYYDGSILLDRGVQQRLRATLPLEAADGTWRLTPNLYLAHDDTGRPTPAGELLAETRPDLFVRSPEALGTDFCLWVGVQLAPPVADLLVLLQEKTWLGHRPAAWFERLYDYLDRQANRRELDLLRRLPIILIPGQEGPCLYSPDGVFLPPESPEQVPPAGRQVHLEIFPRPERVERFLEKLGVTRPAAPTPAKTTGPAAAVKETAVPYTPWRPAEQPIIFDPEVAAIVGELRQKMGAALGDAGRLGEQLACIWLKRTLAAKYQGAVIETDSGFIISQAGRGIASLTWANKAGERYFPFDIKVTEGGSEHFYEVKSTTGPAGESFKISMEEWVFARDQGSQAHILLIVEATREPKIIDIPHPFQRWQQKQLKVERFNLALTLERTLPEPDNSAAASLNLSAE